MPISTPHAQYTYYADEWAKLRACNAGQKEIKAGGETYLPRPSGQTETEYGCYRERALFYNATGRTLTGLMGSMFRRSPTVKTNGDEAEAIAKNVDLTGRSLDTFTREVAQEDTLIGRYGILVEHQRIKPGRAYLCGYPTESILSWRETLIDGAKVLTRVVLAEKEEIADPEDEFSTECRTFYRVLELVEGRYVQRIFKDAKGEGDYLEVETIAPEIFGSTLTYIPFVFVGVNDLGADVEQSPLSDLADVNISHYRTSADLEHARHFLGCPTVWASGVPTTDAKGNPVILPIGSPAAWLLPPNSSVGMLTLPAEAVGALEKALEQKENQAAHLGASLLRVQKREAETAESMRLQSAGETSLLHRIVAAVEAALQKALGWLCEWMGLAPDAIELTLSREFFESALDAEQGAFLLQLYQAKAITLEVLLGFLEESEALPGDMTAKDLLAKVMAAKAAQPTPSPTPPPPPNGTPPPPIPPLPPPPPSA